VICACASFAVALVFWLVTTFTGEYTPVARWGGAAWIFLLVMIVLMPIVIPRMKRRQRTEQEASCSLPTADRQS
jgi:Na+/melibiose symporter-like transporter